MSEKSQNNLIYSMEKRISELEKKLQEAEGRIAFLEGKTTAHGERLDTVERKQHPDYGRLRRLGDKSKLDPPSENGFPILKGNNPE